MNIDFYILELASKQRATLFACQLIEKAYLAGKKVYVHTGSLEEAEHLDTLLWTYKEDSFLPHQLYDENDAYAPLIQIGYDHPREGKQEVLINLCADVPAFFQQFTEIIEIVFSDPTVQQLARARYKQYRDQGLNINTYKLKANEI